MEYKKNTKSNFQPIQYSRMKLKKLIRKDSEKNNLRQPGLT
jgi:hypothetical protein